jgi:hypothetical protein
VHTFFGILLTRHLFDFIVVLLLAGEQFKID